MKSLSLSARHLFIAMLIVCVCGNASAEEQGPTYANEETKRVITAMVEAHGGLKKWQQAATISFDNIMHNNYHQQNEFAWWVAHETIDQSTRQVYQEWPYDDARIGFDGKEVWSQNWQRGNVPDFMVHFFYYFVNLPWITQDDNVILSEVGRYQWPGQDKEFYEVKLTFESAPTVGKAENDYFVLYIDPDSYLITGYQYAVGYRPQLDVMNIPQERAIFGPLWRQIIRYEEVDGLIFPAAFRTSPEPGARIVGNHLIMNIQLTKPFDYNKAKAPITD